MKQKAIPVMAVLVAIVITTTMDFMGFFLFSAYPLLLISLIFWFILRLSKSEIGLTFGSKKYYGIALLYPISVLGTTAFIAYLLGEISVENTNWTKTCLNIALASTVGILLTLITEEGFFRGWLWGAFKKTGWTSKKTLIVTSFFFVIWHTSAVLADTDYGLPLSQIPIYLINGFLLGLIWGTLRWASGSIIAASLCHAVWNALAYILSGFGEKVGALGIKNTFLLGPEVGYLGVVLNGLFFLWLWHKTKSQRRIKDN